MRRLSANYIYTINQPPLKNGIIEVNQEGAVRKVIDTGGKLKESRNLEFFNGVITPGFINSHCHLELSYLKDKIAKKKGLPGFLEGIIKNREEKNHVVLNSIKTYDSEMNKQGIVAVGDISNTNQTIPIKKESKIFYHTYIESIGLKKDALEIFKKSKSLQKSFLSNGLDCSIVPHAPYSVSRELFQYIKELAVLQNSIITIHNQESDSEKEMFVSGTGELINIFKKSGIDIGSFKSTGKNSISSILDLLPRQNHIIFVHNTFSNKKDVELVNQHFKNAYWCLCPSSNLNLENQLPDLDIFKKLSRVTLGTDSLASNDSLSILEEMKVINHYDPDISFGKLIEWATINGARALKIDDRFGSLEIDKTPGINLITNFDFDNMQISAKSEVKVLI